MKLVVRREVVLRDRVLGTLLVDGEAEAFTLEDQVRETNEPVERWKVRGCTAIPRGTYNVVVTHSPHFKREMPLVENVPGFDGVRIHSGNQPTDTEGCILVGRVRVANHLEQSREAFDDLFKLIKEAVDVGEKVELEIA